MDAEFSRRRRFLVFEPLPLPGRRLRQAYSLQQDCGRDRQKLFERVLAKDLVYAFAGAGDRRSNQQGICRRVQLKLLTRVCQGIRRDQRGDV